MGYDTTGVSVRRESYPKFYQFRFTNRHLESDTITSYCISMEAIKRLERRSLADACHKLDLYCHSLFPLFPRRMIDRLVGIFNDLETNDNNCVYPLKVQKCEAQHINEKTYQLMPICLSYIFFLVISPKLNKY